MATESLLDLHHALRRDPLRPKPGADPAAGEIPFSADMVDAARLLHMPFTADHEVAEGLNKWCEVWQPCQFGRRAAKAGQIAFCFLRWQDLADGDDAIREKIARARQLWKQRAAYDRRRPPHSLLVVCATPELERAAPDDNLRRFADRLLELSGWRPQRRVPRGENPVASDYLYLQFQDDTYLGFQFNTDFFAAAGHGRWWQDHRFPGGIAFTANATGHMKAFRERFGADPSANRNWALIQAMMTVAKAHATKPEAPADVPRSQETAIAEGRLTWLLDLRDGKPVVPDLPCPYGTNVPKAFRNKDWTKYEGWIHTDHAVRREFFEGWIDPTTQAPPDRPLNDLTYLYDDRQEEFRKFTGGVPFTRDEVYADIGRPEEFRHLGVESPIPARTPDQVRELAAVLARCRAWGLSPEDERLLSDDA